MSSDQPFSRESKQDADVRIVSDEENSAGMVLSPKGALRTVRRMSTGGHDEGLNNDRTDTNCRANYGNEGHDVSNSDDVRNSADVSFRSRSLGMGGTASSSKALRCGQGEPVFAAWDSGDGFPGLSDDLALDILARVPRGAASSLRGVSRAWRRIVRSPELQAARRQRGALEEWLVAMLEGQGRRLQLMALDPCLRRWSPLPVIPLPAHTPTSPAPADSAAALIPGCLPPLTAAATGGDVDVRSGAEAEERAAPLPTLEGFGCVAAAGKLLVIGGVERSVENEGTWRTEVTSAVWEFDPATWHWSPAPPMHTPRGWCAAGVLSDRFVYVSGGQGRTAFLNSVEMFDMQTRQWCYVSSMHMARCSHRTVTLGNTLVVIAGEWERHDQLAHEHRQLARPYRGVLPYASMEVYDPAADSWTLLRDSWISTDKVPCPVAAVNGVLYAVHHGSVHAWDPQTRHWRYCGDTPGRDTFGRPCRVAGQGCAELDGRLVLFGGLRDVWLNRTRLTQQDVSTVHVWAPPPPGSDAPGCPHLWEAPTSLPDGPARLAQAGAAVSSFQSAAHSIMLWKELPPLGAGHGGAILASAVVRA